MKPKPPDTMDADSLRAVGIRLFGDKHWQAKLARKLGVHRSQVTRWLQGRPIPGPVRAALLPVEQDAGFTGSDS